MIRRTSILKKENILYIVLSYILSTLVAVFVYLTGGTSSAFANLMYIPIATISSTNGKLNGAIHAAICGLLLGPFMPVDSNLGIAQAPINWVIRLSIYVIISFIIGSFSDFNKRSKEYITNLLTHDTITNLKNIEAIKREATSKDERKTIIALSVGEYEEILSFFGYDFTNRAILNFSEKLKTILSKYKKVDLYRYDGMEFVIVITHDDKLVNTDEILKALKSMHKSTINIDDIPIYIEIIMGIANVEAGITILEGVRQAIVSLRYAIEKGNRMEVYNNHLDNHFMNVVSIANEFRVALKHGAIKAAYQNIYHSETGDIHGCELLSRWVSDDQSVYSPGEFISIIERTELINDLTKHMIDKAIEKLLKDKDKNIFVSINFSPKDFKDEVIDYLIDTVDNHNVNPKLILIEITEDIFLKKEVVIGYLYKLRSRGMSIAIDDFGSGYSSYKYLSEFPIDIIKIDGSIINKIQYNHVSRSLVKSIVEFSKVNNIRTVAEGVENVEVVKVCRDLGIDYIQGYYVHQPTLIN